MQGLVSKINLLKRCSLSLYQRLTTDQSNRQQALTGAIITEKPNLQPKRRKKGCKHYILYPYRKETNLQWWPWLLIQLHNQMPHTLSKLVETKKNSSVHSLHASWQAISDTVKQKVWILCRSLTPSSLTWERTSW